jgi:hypothetical protein
VPPGLTETARENADGTRCAWRRRIEVKQLARVRVLEDEPSAPGVDVRHPAAATLLLRPARCFRANALKMTRLLS